MSDKSVSTLEEHAIELPAFGKSTALKMDMTSIRAAETRVAEVKTVNPSTYSELEYVFNEAYRDLRRHLTQITFQITMTQKALEEARADVLMGSYAEYLQGKPKYNDNANMREAFFAKDPVIESIVIRLAQLRAFESNFDGKIKFFENHCRAMRKKMDLILRSGGIGQIR